MLTLRRAIRGTSFKNFTEVENESASGKARTKDWTRDIKVVYGSHWSLGAHAARPPPTADRTEPDMRKGLRDCSDAYGVSKLSCVEKISSFTREQRFRSGGIMASYDDSISYGLGFRV